MPRSAFEVISACRLFAGLDEPARRRLAALAAARRFAAGQRVFDEGGEPAGVYIVDAGRVRVYKLSPQGREHVLHVVCPGETFAEVAVLGGMPLPASAEALDPTRCALLPTAPLRAALRADHQLCLQLLGGMAQWVRHTVRLLEDVVLRDAAGRVARYLLDIADDDRPVELPLLKRHLASHLNLTSETLSRVLRRLDDGGLIRAVDARTLRVVDRAGLRGVMDGAAAAR